ncbi:MAG: hypothetical protein TUN42_04365 [Dehalogenimonas sp.]
MPSLMPYIKYTSCPKCGRRGELPVQQLQRVDPEAMRRLALQGKYIKGDTLQRVCEACMERDIVSKESRNG